VKETARRTVLLLAAAALTGCSADRGAPDPDPPRETTAPAPEPLRTVHVDPAGDDHGRGTATDPWASLTAALARLVPGDRLVVHGGEFEEDVNPVTRPGTPAAPVSVVAAEGESPRVRGLVRLRDPDHWDISGLSVRWRDGESASEHMVKVTGGRNWTWQDSEFSGARSYAAFLVAGRPRNFRLAGLHAHDTWPANGVNQDHLLYLNCGTGGGVVEDCRLVNSPNGRGIKVGPAAPDLPGVGNLVLRRNVMVDNLGPSNVQLAWSVSDVLLDSNVMVRPAPDRDNVTFHRLRGDRIVLRDNEGRESSGVCDWSDPAVVDAGGNTWS